MKDSYSFDLDEDGLAASYQRHRAAYVRIFDRLGVRYSIARATSGAMGGSASEEFLAESDVGEDTYLRSPAGFAVNVEAAAGLGPGDAAPDGSGPLAAARGIEVAHIFQLGRKYTDAFRLDVSGPDGRPVRLTMGSYGIGVSRLVAAIAEQHHDAYGLTWPSTVAPFDVHVVIAGDAGQPSAAEDLSAALSRRGSRVLLDDRAERAGVKFADAELLGVPVIVVVGRGLATGTVEVRDRASGHRDDIALDAAVDHLAALAGAVPS